MKNIKLTLSLILLSVCATNAQNKTDSTTYEPQKTALATKSDAKTRNFKVSPSFFLIGYIPFTYEKSLKQGRSLELKLALIGTGITPPDKESKPRGLAATVGYKFIYQGESPKESRYQHVLRGWYFRPDFTISVYQKSYSHDIYEPTNISPVVKTERVVISYACLVPTVGFQKVWRKGFVADFFMGVGAGVVAPINGEGVFSATEYSNYMFLKKNATQKIGFSYAIKTGILIGGLF